VHAYSVEIHNYIRKQIALAEEKKRQAEKQGDVETQQFHEGQLKELFEIRGYLTEKIDLKNREYY
jgi:hypothetical protein